MAAVMFVDIAGYMSLNQDEIMKFAECALPSIADVVHRFDSFYTNTLGDSIVAIFNDPIDALKCAFELRSTYNKIYEEMEFSGRLELKVALHSGVVYSIKDPLKGGIIVVGSQLDLAARLVRLTKPGHILATSEFVSSLQGIPDKTIVLDDIGEFPLVKAWTLVRVYRVRYSSESSTTHEEIWEYTRAESGGDPFSEESFRRVILRSLQEKSLEFTSIDGPSFSIQESQSNITFTLSFVLNKVILKDFPGTDALVSVYLRYELPSKKISKKVALEELRFPKGSAETAVYDLIKEFNNRLDSIMDETLENIASYINIHEPKAKA
jgi:class 3 adenylate cyclase